MASLYYTTASELTSIADALRLKTRDSSPLAYPSGFLSAIDNFAGWRDYASVIKSQKHIYEDIETEEAFAQAIALEDISTKYVERELITQYKQFSTLSTYSIQPRYSGYSSYSYKHTSDLIGVVVSSVTTATAFGVTATPYATNIRQSFYNMSTSYNKIGSTKFYVSYYEYFWSSYNPYVYSGFSWDRNLSNDTIWIHGSGTVPSVNKNTYWKAMDFHGIKLDSTILSIGSSAFYEANIYELSFPYCTHIGQYAFYNCTELTSVNSPSCQIIYSSAFYSCQNLTNISFPLCRLIYSSAFRYCGIISAYFPSCTTIYDYAFCNCQSLTTANFSACVTLSNYAFSACASLTTASFPVCVTIRSNAFNGCSKLMSLYLLSSLTVSLLNSNAFSDTPMYDSSYLGYFGSIYVPASLVSEYQANDVWSWYADRFVGV